jgi:hypothetical protein
MASPSPLPWTRLLGDHGLRASDDEREWVIDRLRVHTGEGRLTPDELGERIDLAYASKTRGDLVRLLRDLPERLPPSGAVVARRPAHQPPRRHRRRAPRWVPLALVAAVLVGLAGGPGDGRARGGPSDEVRRAAVEHAGGGTIADVDRERDGWDIEVRRDDGSLAEVEVQVDDAGNVVRTQTED